MASNEDEGCGPMLLAIICAFCFLASLVYLLRLYTDHKRRLTDHKRHLYAANYTVGIAMFADLLEVAFAVIAIRRGFGKHTSAIPSSNVNLINILLLVAWINGAIASGLTRISIACVLHRLFHSRRYRYYVKVVIVLESLSILTCGIGELVVYWVSKALPSRTLTLAFPSICILSDFSCVAIIPHAIHLMNIRILERVIILLVLFFVWLRVR